MQTAVYASQETDAASFGTSVVHRQNLRVDLIEDSRGLEALRPEWSELLAGSGANCLFLTWEWLASWWNHLSERRALNVLTVRRGDRLVAIAPLAERPSQPERLRPFRVLEFMGMGAIGSDYLDIITQPDEEEGSLQALADYLHASRRVIDLRRVHASSPRIIRLLTLLGREGWCHGQAVTDKCPYIALAGHSWKSYLATVSRAHRANVNRRQRRLGEFFRTVEFLRADTEEERREYFTLFLRLHQLRWSGRERSNAFTGPGTLAFHTDFSQLALERGWLRLFVLRLDGKAVASTYSFRYLDTFYYYQAGYDPSFADHSVGLATLAMAVQSALAEGVREVDLLHGRESYKALWTHVGRELSRIHCYPPSAGGRVYRQAVTLRAQLKRLMRRPTTSAEQAV